MEFTDAEVKEIQKAYDDGLTHREVQKRYEINASTSSALLKGRRSRSDAMKLARKRGRVTLSEDGRRRLSENGKKSIRNSQKMWTKPEKQFVKILRSMGIGVRFPDYMMEFFGVNSDDQAFVFAQYPIQRYTCDFVDVRSKVVYSVQGDFWHSNPILYDESSLCDVQRFNRKRDANKRRYLESRGWNVIEIWESEIQWNKGVIRDKVGRLSQLVSEPVLHTGSSRFESEVAHHVPDWSERLKELWFKKKREVKRPILKTCQFCGERFETKKDKRKFCSFVCAMKSTRRVERPTKVVLVEEMKEVSWLALGRKYGVSGNAVRKWAKSYGIIQ